MTLTPLAISLVTATSVATIALASVGEGMDAATITIIGTVACAIITSLTVAIVKILGALQAMKVALIEAKAERAVVAGKVIESGEKLHAIKESTDGNLSAMGKRLDDALTRMDDMQKSEAKVLLPASVPLPLPVIAVNTPEAPVNVSMPPEQPKPNE